MADVHYTLRNKCRRVNGNDGDSGVHFMLTVTVESLRWFLSSFPGGRWRLDGAGLTNCQFREHEGWTGTTVLGVCLLVLLG